MEVASVSLFFKSLIITIAFLSKPFLAIDHFLMWLPKLQELLQVQKLCSFGILLIYLFIQQTHLGVPLVFNEYAGYTKVNILYPILTDW